MGITLSVPITENGDYLATPAPATVTMAAAYDSLGDMPILIGAIMSASVTVTEVVGTQSGTWIHGPRLYDSGTGAYLDSWIAFATATTAPDVLTITYSGSVSAIEANWWPFAISAGYGAATAWDIGSGAGTAGSGTTIDYESIPGFDNAYEQGGIWFAVSGSAAEGGSIPGFTYIDSPGPTLSGKGGSGNELAYDLSLTPGAGGSPTSTQSSAHFATIGFIVEAWNTAVVPAPTPPAASTPTGPVTDSNGVILGTPPGGIPHLAMPFAIGPGGSALTLQQDTNAEVIQSVAMLVGTRPGTRTMAPKFGMADPTFTGINQPALKLAVRTWEPRASVNVAVNGFGEEYVTVSVINGASQ